MPALNLPSMKRLFTLLSCVWLSAWSWSSLQAQTAPIELPLWPEGPTESNGLTGPETIVGSRHYTSNVSVPTLTFYPARADRNTGISLILAPGGGYAALALPQEGEPAARWLAEQGISGLVLKYRMPNGHRCVPLDDAQQAMRLIRAHAQEWGIDTARIGIMGFSAGGHLASTLLTHYEADTRPAFGILCYPVISFADSLAHRGSMLNLLGADTTAAFKDYYSNERHVTPDTPPTLLLLSNNDGTVKTRNSTLFYDALKQNRVPAALYLFPTGGHGWGFQESFVYHELFKTLVLDWIRFLYPETTFP